MKITTALAKVQPSYIREILSTANRPEVISFAGGLPELQSFPMTLINEALAKLHNQPALFQYANTEGYPPLLNFCRAHYALDDTQTALICNGSQQGLDLIARAFIDPQDCVALQAPSYLGALQVFDLAQAKIVSINTDNQGPNLAELEQCFASNKVKIFYAVPDFHNPTGACWSLHTRKRVAQLCRQYQVTLLEDVPYRELRFSGENLPLVSSLCPENSIVLRSFSKSIAPGIRLGLVSGPKAWLAALVKVKKGDVLHTNVPMQALLFDILTHTDFANHSQNLKRRYRDKYRHMANILSSDFASVADFTPIEGGMFIWLKIRHCDTDALAREALLENVAIVPSSVFFKGKIPNNSAIRLNFTQASTAQIELGLKRLLKVIMKLQHP